jgi:hypothetical protein
MSLGLGCAQQAPGSSNTLELLAAPVRLRFATPHPVGSAVIQKPVPRITRSQESKSPMRKFESRAVGLVRAGAVALVLLSLTGCETLRIERKADELRRSGVARDMADARKMAEQYYWAEAAQLEHEARRESSAIFALKRDAKK